MNMQVTKRNGQREPVKFDKVTTRIDKLCYGLSADFVSPVEVAQKVIDGIYDGVSTIELDNLAAETAAALTTRHPDYAILGARIAVSNLHKVTSKSFSATMKRLYHYVDPKTQQAAPLLAQDVWEIIHKNAQVLDAAIDYERDFTYDYFGFKTLEKSYLLRLDGKVVERPQHMLMRVSVGIHKHDIDSAIKTYNMMSERWMTHATPTLFNAGTPKPQMSSCFLLTMKDDSIEGIYQTLKDCALISQSAGGIGLAASNIRATGSYIRGTSGVSNGLVPMLKVFNDTARYVDQGGGKRKGAFAIYLEPWHADVFEFLELKKNHGKEEMRARDLFYALWTPDLFMKRVEANGDWTLMCPNECPGLNECWGAEFEALYTKYEQEGKGRKTIKAQELWFAILESQTETGTPYMLFKDAANGKSNQQNLGTIKSSNLCVEIIEFTDKDEIAVCNLASLALARYVAEKHVGIDYGTTEEGARIPVGQLTHKYFDHDKLYEVTYQTALNLNKVIDVNYYPVPETQKSNFRHRPIGIGVQGLADTFLELGLAFESPEAQQLNIEIFETIYFAAMTASKDLAKAEYLKKCLAEGYAWGDKDTQYIGAYETFVGSPLSEGKFQFDLWGVTPKSGRYDWDELRKQVLTYGVRNSLLVAPMPTASTSQILGYNESFEPYTSNIYVRRVLSGEFMMVNKYLVRELITLGQWNEQMKQDIIAANGSVQGIASLPADLKARYKTVWEISQRTIIDMSADRGAYVCQSQSLNLHVQNVNFGKLTSMHFHSWKRGLKTGMYYLRTKAAADAIKFTVPSGKEVEVKVMSAADNQAAMICSIDNRDACEACGS